MKLYIKQKLFTLKDRFNVLDEHQQDVYSVEGKLFTLARELSVKDSSMHEVIFLKQRLWHMFPHIDVTIHQKFAFQVVMKWAWFKQKYDIVGINWTVEGNFMAHQYTIYDNDSQVVATISKAWLSWSDYYELNVFNNDYVQQSLAIVLAIDIAMATTRSNANT